MRLCMRDTNLIDESSCKAADNVADEEEAGDPGAEEEVDLDRVVGRRPLHHLRDRHAREGEPAANDGGPEGDAYCSQHLRPTSDNDGFRWVELHLWQKVWSVDNFHFLWHILNLCLLSGRVQKMTSMSLM